MLCIWNQSQLGKAVLMFHKLSCTKLHLKRKKSLNSKEYIYPSYAATIAQKYVISMPNLVTTRINNHIMKT